MIFLNYIKQSEREQFASKLTQISSHLGINPDHLMAVFYKESRCNPQARNSGSNAAGLIQFMPSTASWLGTSTAALLSMTATQQLSFVEMYFMKLGMSGKLKDYTDVYLAVFFPVAVGQPENWILHTSQLSPYTIATSNPVIDLNKDHAITVSEFRQYARSKMPNEVLEALKTKAAPAAGMLIILSLGGYLLYRYAKRTKKIINQ